MRDLPSATVPPSSALVIAIGPAAHDDDDDHPSGVFDVLKVPLVVVAVDDDALREAVIAILATKGLDTIGGDAMESASTVIVDARNDLSRIAAARSRAPAEAAIVAVVVNDVEAVASAHRAGAFACVRHPLVAEEMLTLVERVAEARSVRFQVADLHRKLDLNAHLTSIGRISAGLSHELGSPLGVAAMNVEFALETLRQKGALGPALAPGAAIDLLTALHDTTEAIGRVQALLSTMGELVRQRPPTLQRIDLVAETRKVVRWAAAEHLQGVIVEEVFEAPTLMATGNALVLQQILMNLVSNAAQAARQLGTPRIRLHVYGDERAGVISVRDNGPGIPSELQDRIFEPFYTTRRGSGGTGLGLALCREYALQIGAKLTLWSVLGRGACFRIQLGRG